MCFDASPSLLKIIWPYILLQILLFYYCLNINSKIIVFTWEDQRQNDKTSTVFAIKCQVYCVRH